MRKPPPIHLSSHGVGFGLWTAHVGETAAARVAIGAVLALTLVPDFDAGGGHEVIVSILGDGWSGRDKKIRYDTWGPLGLWTLSYPPMSKSCKRFEAFLVGWGDIPKYGFIFQQTSNNYFLICDLLGILISLANIFCSWWRQPPKTELYICHRRSLSQVGLESKDETRIHTLIDGWLSGIHGKNNPSPKIERYPTGLPCPDFSLD